MSLVRALRELRWRAAGHYSRKLPEQFTRPLHGLKALEIGGPSRVFTADGLLPIYPIASSVDCVQWAARTFWHTLDPAQGFQPDGVRRGELYILDDLDLGPLPDDAYELVFCSHVLEHIANPLRALRAWRRVTRPGGYLLVVAPHMSGTFDHRRPLTPLSHIIEDFERSVGEDDLTHLEEVIELHDHSLDATSRDRAAWLQRHKENVNSRVLHHHTFTTRSLLTLLDYNGLELLACEVRYPHDIYVLGRWPEDNQPVDNSEFLAARHPSPFAVDRR
jgi:SAM-dependent methyltransferase